MHIGEAAVAALIEAKHEAGQDLFLLPDTPFLPAHAAALSSALGKNLLVFLPGAFYPAAEEPAVCFQHGAQAFRFPPAPFVCYADIRLAANEAFGAAMQAADVCEWILPFADCADPAEHGYRRSYGYLAELRAQSPRFTGITALFDDRPEEERYRAFFASRGYAAVGDRGTKRYPAVRAKNDAERLRLLSRRCTAQLDKRTVVLFPTRRHVEEFVRTVKKQCPCAAVHGGLPTEANADAIDRFRAGALPVLAATKHLLPSAPFLQADRVLFGGLPFSPALLGRASALLPPDAPPPLCVVTEADRALNEKLAVSFAQTLDLPVAAFTRRRNEKQTRAIALLAE